MEHDLKVWPEFFEPLLSGAKTFELRFNDRQFRVGDTLILNEWDIYERKYTGRKIRKKVTHVMFGTGAFGLEEDHVCMSLADETKE